MYRLTILLFPLTLIILGCGQDNRTEAPVVARVNTTVLTADDFEKINYGYDNYKKQELTELWVRSELLYQAGVEADLDKDQTIVRAVDKFRRELIGEIFLEKELLRSVHVSDAEISSYYREHKKSFARETEEARIYHFILPDLPTAKEVIKTLSDKKSGDERKKILESPYVSLVSVKKGRLLSKLDSAIFQNRSKKNIIGPVKIESGFHVLHVINRFKKGSVPSIDLVFDEIRQRLINQKTALLTVGVLDSLRAKALIEINMENIK